ncbi:Multi antimicrobial extrusion protein (Na(+)/drug antiporter), MATE family of MDR efflux pumps [hydrothermal vent metagenome]|uniref:Multi antimicrobial extrusion protein (Na(+)/drug antiporter), MATE family of MDR efflux pumps n=1 Tax=hydrothermal vent metagenome TaxID=652676 RepID=A0A3B0RDJ5_9ZZZZ
MGHLLRLGIPMSIGIFAVMSAAVIDTFYVSRLGTTPLAAISFCVPLLFVLQSLSVGLGAGASSVVSRAAGEGDHDRLSRQTTDSVLLAILIVAIFATIGILSFENIVRFAGASEELMPDIRSYLRISFIGSAFIVGPMVAGNILRALGDARVAGFTMVGGALINLILDPFLIFGIGPFPRMEVAGAALATVLSNVVAVVVMGWYMVHREKLIVLKIPPWEELSHSWWEVLKVGVPATATNIANPITIFVITAAFATFGDAAVAGLGVAGRIEFLFAIPLLALSASIGPITGQNGGAGQLDRVRDAFRSSYLISVIWATGTGITLFLLSGFVARLFSDDPEVQNVTQLYLSIVPLTAVGYGIVISTSAGFNALGRPLPGMFMTFGRSFVLSSGGVWLGAQFYGIKGAIIALALSNIIAGFLTLMWMRTASLQAKQRKRHHSEQTTGPPTDG